MERLSTWKGRGARGAGWEEYAPRQGDLKTSGGLQCACPDHAHGKAHVRDHCTHTGRSTGTRSAGTGVRLPMRFDTPR